MCQNIFSFSLLVAKMKISAYLRGQEKTFSLLVAKMKISAYLRGQEFVKHFLFFSISG
jgi:cellobiose-specific phosphotransferase system component IIB